MKKLYMLSTIILLSACAGVPDGMQQNPMCLNQRLQPATNSFFDDQAAILAQNFTILQIMDNGSAMIEIPRQEVHLGGYASSRSETAWIDLPRDWVNQAYDGQKLTLKNKDLCFANAGINRYTSVMGAPTNMRRLQIVSMYVPATQ